MRFPELWLNPQLKEEHRVITQFIQAWRFSRTPISDHSKIKVFSLKKWISKEFKVLFCSQSTFLILLKSFVWIGKCMHYTIEKIIEAAEHSR